MLLCKLAFCIKNVTKTTSKWSLEPSQNRQKRDSDVLPKSTSKTEPDSVQTPSENGVQKIVSLGFGPQNRPLEAQIPTWRPQDPKITKI